MVVNQPIISFIIPIFNTQHYLATCLDSVLRQTINKEIILIDDGSKDDSINISLDYTRKYDCITLIHSSKNNGQSAARNKGIKLAKGKYIYFVDSDDLLLAVDLKKICCLAEQYQVDLVKFQAQFQIESRENTNPIRQIFSNPFNVMPRQAVLVSGEEYLAKVVKHWIPGVCWTLIRRDFLLKNNISFMENVKAEDQLFYVQLLTCQAKVNMLDIGDVIYHYRMRKNSTISTYNPQYFVDHFTICRLLQEWIDKNQFSYTISENILMIMARIYQTALTLYKEFSDEDKQKYAHYLSPQLYQFVDHYLKKASLS